MPKDIIYQPELAKYVRGWGKDNDLGFIALTENDSVPVGAVWIRLFNKSDPGYGYLSNEIPELSISVLPEYRNRGIGTNLLDHLLRQVREDYSAISLSVSKENPALHLYLRFGFEVIDRDDNSDSLIMKKDLQKYDRA